MSAAKVSIQEERTLTADGEDDSGVHPVRRGLPPGTLVGRYRTSRAIGEGAQGVVYEGEHLTLGYRVAIKVMHADCDEARRARFRREARLGATLRHRHVVQVLEAGELDDGAPYLVMEHVDGCSLADLVDHRRLGPASVAELGEQLLSALAALGERGILHRDVKPDNIMLERAVDGHVSAKLLDFGISKATHADLASRTLTQDGTVLGTPYYMAPEQLRGEDLDQRTDLYSAAGVLYEAVSGRPPHDGPTTAAVLARIATEPVTPLREIAPECPAEIATIIDRALLADREARWRHPLEMAEALRGAAARLGLPRGADAWAEVVEDTEGWFGTSAISLRCVTPRARIPSQASSDVMAARAPRFGGRARWLAIAAAGVIGLGATFVSATDAALAKSAEGAKRTVLAAAAPAAPVVHAVGGEVAPEQLDELERSARGLFVRGETAAAMAMYRTVVEQAPQRATAWRGLGLVAAASGDADAARPALNRYLELAPQADDRDRIERELDRLP